MPCTPFDIDGMRGIVCTRGGRQKRCSVCNAPRAGVLCDFPIGKGKTCDKPLCGRCAKSVAPGIDHCPDHGEAPPVTGDLFG